MQVAAGYQHTVGLKEDGTVVADGYTGDRQFDVSGCTGIRQVAGYGHTVGMEEDESGGGRRVHWRPPVRCERLDQHPTGRRLSK